VTDPDRFKDILTGAAELLTENNQQVILEAFIDSLVDFYVFSMEPGNDLDDIGFLVSTIKDMVCDAVVVRRHLIDSETYDPQQTEVCPVTLSGLYAKPDSFFLRRQKAAYGSDDIIA